MGLDLSTCLDEDVTEYALFRIKEYEDEEYRDEELWEAVKEDFYNFDEKVFERVDRVARNKLRSKLRRWGVWIQAKPEHHTSKALAALIKEDIPTQWIIEEVDYCLKRGTTFEIGCIKALLANKVPKTTVQDVKFDLQSISPKSDNIVSSKLPKRLATKSSGFPTTRDQLSNSKSYNKKYSGEGDSFLAKKRIFLDLTDRAGKPPELHFKAFPRMLCGPALDYFYESIINRPSETSFSSLCSILEDYFEGKEYRMNCLTQWNSLTFKLVIAAHPTKSLEECFELLLSRASISAWKEFHHAEKFPINGEESFTDRRYLTRHSKSQKFGRILRVSKESRSLDQTKKCFVCRKQGCWSTNHSKAEQDQAYSNFKQRLREKNKPYNDKVLKQYLIAFEGEEEFDELDALIMDLDLSIEYDDDEKGAADKIESTQYQTSVGKIDGYEAVSALNDQSARHAITKTDSSSFSSLICSCSESLLPSPSSSLFSFCSCSFPSPTSNIKSRYSDSAFQGILIDTGAARVLTAGQDQFNALKKIQNLHLNLSHAGHAKACFSIGTTSSIGTTIVQTPMGKIVFHVVPSNTPFLLSLQDMDHLEVQFLNLSNILIQKNNIVPVIRKRGHPWMLLGSTEKSIVHSYIGEITDIPECHLSEPEL
ncbi:hypothetical protein GcM3_039032, partial [Golovinomyces cichoracearum]